MENAKQGAHIERLETVDERLESIQDDLSATRETVVRLETKLETIK